MTDLNKMVDELSKLSVMEAAELSKLLQDKWGVSAAAPVAAAAPAAAAGDAGGEEEADDAPVDIHLTEVGDKKVDVIIGGPP